MTGIACGALCLSVHALAADPQLQRWQAEAQSVSIVRDDWGIAHVRADTDAHAVFGLIYEQAEDDFKRVEANYLTALGRTAEAEGERAIYADLRMQLFIDPHDLQQRYAASPRWLKQLMDAWADGLNYYLATHPQVVPRVLKHFEPWMALSFTEGSIGGDIERVSLAELEAFYGQRSSPAVRNAPPSENKLADEEAEARRATSGSNGIAIAPADSASHHALLLINPHTSFFFRSEVQVSSQQGLNAYGAVTWGQFFVYQGFNEHVGWMHTSTGADDVDEFAETVADHAGRPFYRSGSSEHPMQISTRVISYLSADGALAQRRFTIYRSSHGPIVRAANGKWISIALMFKPVEALSQSFLRTKAHDYRSYLQVAQLKANSSNNTIFADADGDIAYLHPQFMPRRDNHFDYSQPVDGSNPAADWHGLHDLQELPHVLNPASGWIVNTNNWPYSAAGADSPKAADYPRYMDSAGENERGLHAQQLLHDQRDLTLQALLALAFDPQLPAFAQLLPALMRAYEQTPADDPVKTQLREPIELLRAWDRRWAADSTATTLAIRWGEQLLALAPPGGNGSNVELIAYMADKTSNAQKLQALANACDRLVHDFDSWRVPWGEINRFQRLNDAIVPTFSDLQPSTPIPFAYSRWGSLASFDARPYQGSKRSYGLAGNSFVAVVEFGPQVQALAVTAGGESGDVHSLHFNDEALRYASGRLRTVYFYPQQLQGHIERSYHPGE